MTDPDEFVKFAEIAATESRLSALDGLMKASAQALEKTQGVENSAVFSVAMSMLHVNKDPMKLALLMAMCAVRLHLEREANLSTPARDR